MSVHCDLRHKVSFLTVCSLKRFQFVTVKTDNFEYSLLLHILSFRILMVLVHE